MTLGEHLKATRTERGLSLRAAADELGCAPQSYRLWEMNVQRPGLERLERIREWIGVDADTLLRELSSAMEEATGAFLAHAV